MDRRNKLSYSVSLILSLILALAAACIRTILLFTEYDSALGHFAYGSYLATSFNVLLAVSLLCFIVPAILIGKKKDVRITYKDIPTLFSTAFLFVTLLLFSIFVGIEAFSLHKTGASLIFTLLASLFAVVSAIYYVLRICDTKISEQTYALLSLAPIVFGCALAFSFYFDNTMYMNSPVIILHQVSALLIAFFALGESRVQLGRAKWGIYVFIAFIAFVALFANSLPSIIYMPKYDSLTNGSIASGFALFAFSLYILSRVFSIYSLNSRDARSLISFFKAVYEESKANRGSDEEPEQLPIDLGGNDDTASEEQN